MRKKQNFIQVLWCREIALTRSVYKLSLKLLRKMVCDKSSTFMKVWEVHSKQPIFCEDGKLYFDNYRTCFTLCGANGLPSELYHIPQLPHNKRTEDCIVYSGPVHRAVTKREEYRGFFLSMSADNWLCSYDGFTGDSLQKVYLGPPSRIKFRHCDWETYGEQLVLTSILNQGHPTTQRGMRPRVLVVLAVFTVLPLEFVAQLEIDREVFGRECNHVNVSEGLLIIGTGSSVTGTVRLYSFPQLLKQGMMFNVKLYEECAALDGEKVGSYPTGLPLNCKVKEAPPILFEVRCSDYIIHFGGHPWHYLSTPPRKEGVFQIRSLDADDLAVNGNLDFPNDSTEPDSIAFHPDDSGRLIYNAAHAIRFFELVTLENGRTLLRECFQFTMTDCKAKKQKTIQRTKSQRAVRRKYDIISISCEKSVLSDDYEEELELYGVLGFDPYDEDSNGKVVLFDNTSGQRIKTVNLKMKLDELSDYTLTLDLETLIIVRRNEARRYSCYIYRLSWPESQISKSNSKEPKKKKK